MIFQDSLNLITFDALGKIVSVNLDDNKLEVVYRHPTTAIMLNNNGSLPKDCCKKYIIQSVDNKLQVVDIIEGYIEPEQRIPEKFVWEEKDASNV